MQSEIILPSQSSSFPLAVLIGILFLALVIRLIAGTMDRTRIERYINSNGGHMLELRWTPFGPGWFGEKDARIYQLTYRDRHRRIHCAHVKTSMFGSVYLTRDVIIREADGHIPTFDGRINPRPDVGRPVRTSAPTRPSSPVAAVHTTPQSEQCLPSCKDLLAENEQLKARIRKLEENIPRS